MIYYLLPFQILVLLGIQDKLTRIEKRLNGDSKSTPASKTWKDVLTLGIAAVDAK